RVTRADTEHHASGRVAIDGGDARGEDARMPRHRIDYQRADMSALRILRGGQEIDENITGVELAVGKPQMVESGSLGFFARLNQPVRVEEVEAVGAEAQLHFSVFPILPGETAGGGHCRPESFLRRRAPARAP